MLLRQMLMLECPTAQIAEAVHGLEALQAMRQEAFDLVFMDMLMPQMDGIEACQRIRAELPAPACHTPVMGLTANVNAQDLARFEQAGLDALMLKPFEPQQLRTQVARSSVRVGPRWNHGPTPTRRHHSCGG